MILTAARTGETVGATWNEFNTADKVWIIPPERMKATKEHRVPLCPRAMAILGEMEEASDAAFVFPGGRAGRPLSNMAMTAVLRRMGREDITAHGFRSSFRDWAAECTNFPSEGCRDGTSARGRRQGGGAYRRGDMFEKWRLLMAGWARFCSMPKAAPVQEKVVPSRQCFPCKPLVLLHFFQAEIDNKSVSAPHF
jgi:hypothetical protein